MSVQMESPTGVLVSVTEAKAERLVANGYRYLEDEAPVDEAPVDEQPAEAPQMRRRGRPPKTVPLNQE